MRHLDTSASGGPVAWDSYVKQYQQQLQEQLHTQQTEAAEQAEPVWPSHAVVFGGQS